VNLSPLTSTKETHELTQQKKRYGWLSMALHWLMLVLLIAVYTFILFTDNFPKGSDTQVQLKTWHFMLGLTVFVLVWVRLIAKLISPTPLIEPPIARWHDITAKAVQALLYVLMIAIPPLGWLTLSAAGKPIPFYGWQLPSLIAENKDLAETIKGIHEAGATAIYFLVGIHAIAALYHRYLVSGNTMRSMLT
jgi:superoxide oxidase